MAYVDLNPIRAGLAKTPEDSEYTSIKARLDALKREQLTAPSLHPFIGNPTNTIIKGIPLRLHDYLELVEWTGRQIREGKTGYITSSIPPLLERLHIEQREWLKACTRFEHQRALIIGTAQSIEIATSQMSRCKAQGYKLVNKLIPYSILPLPLIVLLAIEPFSSCADKRHIVDIDVRWMTID